MSKCQYIKCEHYTRLLNKCINYNNIFNLEKCYQYNKNIIDDDCMRYGFKPKILLTSFDLIHYIF